MVPEIGCTLDELDTPALVLDLDILERNIAQAVELCRRHGKQWRPHSKAHKSPAIAALEIAAGACGVTCAKLGEAEVMAGGGISGLLVANQVATAPKVRRLIDLARHSDVIVAVDDLAQAEPISAAAAAAGVQVGMLPEVDIGLHRCGVPPGEPALRLAREVARLPGLVFRGIMGYEGHLLGLADPAEKDRRIRQDVGRLVETAELLARHDLPCPIVSAGGTGSLSTTVSCPGVTELQAGGLIFMDNYYRHTCHVDLFEVSLTLLVSVVSRPAPERAIIDAGRKSQNAEVAQPTVLGRQDMRVGRLSAEHGQLELDPSARDLRVGDRLQLVLGYTDFSTVLHDEFYGFRRGRLERILPLSGRGKIR